MDFRITCDLCSSDSHRRLATCKDRRYPTGYSGYLVKCNGCGLISTYPKPPEDEIGAYYQESYAVYRVTGDKFRFSSLLRTALARGSQLPEFLRKPILTAYNFAAFRSLPDMEPGRVLDVGAGVGDFLANLRDLGWQVHGVEPSARAAESARERGLDVLEGTILHSQLQDATFDLITFWHVLEHIHSPTAALNRAFELLKPGGKLMVAVPNWKSVKRRVLHDGWWRMETPRHLYHFTPSTLSRALSEANFDVEKLSGKTSAAQITNTIRLMPETSLSARQKLVEVALTPVEFVAAPALRGDDLWVIARRP